jgi:hypothetical protein
VCKAPKIQHGITADWNWWMEAKHWGEIGVVQVSRILILPRFC